MAQKLPDNNKRTSHGFKNWPILAILVVVLALYIVLRIWSLWTPYLWGDEVFTFSLSQGSWITLIKRAGLDMAHPPLFYLLLKLWIYVAGGSMPELRVLTVALSILTVVPFIALARRLGFQLPVIILALTLMALSNYLVLYGYYLRAYSLLLFLSLSSEALFVKFLKSRESEQTLTLVILTSINILFLYTHYFALLIIIAEFLWVAATARKLLRQLTISTAIVGVCFLPWVGVIGYVSTQVSYTFLDQITWYKPPGVNSLLLLLRCFNGGFDSKALTIAGSIIFLLIVLTSLRSSRVQVDSADRKPDPNLYPYVLLAWLSFFPVVVSYAFSKVFTWIWEPRYVIVATGSYLLLVSACAFRLRNPYPRAVAIVFLLAWSSVAGFTGNLATVLHGPNGTSFLLAQDLSQKETRSEGPINIYGISPYAEQGLRLALSLTGERRFETKPCAPDVAFSDEYFWLAVTEHDPIAMARVKELSSGQLYQLGEPLYRGPFPERHMLIPVRRKMN